MSIDLSKCVPNQKVVTRNGRIGTFIGISIEPNHPYKVRIPEALIDRTYTQEGYWVDEFNIDDSDIVEILPIDWHWRTNSELLEENTKLKTQIADLEQEVGMLKAKYDALKDEYEALKDECFALKSKSNKLKDEICALAVRLTRLCRD